MTRSEMRALAVKLDEDQLNQLSAIIRMERYLRVVKRIDSGKLPKFDAIEREHISEGKHITAIELYRQRTGISNFFEVRSVLDHYLEKQRKRKING